MEYMAYRSTEGGFQQSIPDLKSFPSAYDRIKNLDVRIWTLHAAPTDVFGRLSSQVAEIFTFPMKNIGVRYCSPAKIIITFVNWSEKRIANKHDAAKGLIEKGKLFGTKTKKRLKIVY